MAVKAILNVTKQPIFKDYSSLTPHVMVKDITCLNYKRIKELGFNSIIFDKDNTVCRPGEVGFANGEI